MGEILDHVITVRHLVWSAGIGIACLVVFGLVMTLVGWFESWSRYTPGHRGEHAAMPPNPPRGGTRVHPGRPGYNTEHLTRALNRNGAPSGKNQ